MARHMYLRDFADSFPLKIIRILSHTEIELHTHDFEELVVVVGGCGLHTVGTEQYSISTGDCFMVTGPHGYSKPQDLSLINILFDPTRLHIPFDEAHKLPGYHVFFTLEPKFRKQDQFQNHLHLKAAELAHLCIMIDELEHELVKQPLGFEFMAIARLMQIIGNISRAYVKKDLPETKMPSLIQISEVISHLERHFSEPVRLKELAKTACMSESSLLRGFKQATGFAPIDYLIRLRVRKAAELLRNPGIQIREIGYQSGFEDSNYFSRQFKRVMRVSPREFRKKYGVTSGISGV